MKMFTQIRYDCESAPLGTRALREPWPPQQSVSTALCLSSSPSTALSSELSDLLRHHPAISSEVFLFFCLCGIAPTSNQFTLLNHLILWAFINFTISSPFINLFNSSCLILQISPSCISPQIFHIIFLSKIITILSPDFVRVQVSAPYVATGLISVLCIYILTALFIILLFSI